MALQYEENKQMKWAGEMGAVYIIIGYMCDPEEVG